MAMKSQPKTGNLTAHKSQPKPGGGYQEDAHSNNYHKGGGTATGSPRDNAPMDYNRKTWAEGAKSQPVAGHPGNTSAGLGGSGPHLVGSAAHPARGADGYRHAAHKRSGVLRMSGASNAHRVGKR